MLSDSTCISVSDEPAAILFRHAAPPVNGLKVSVIVPVKDEALYLVKTLDALRNQTDEAGSLLSSNIYEVLVMANNCSDNSFSLMKTYQQQHPDFNLHIDEAYLPKAMANIGTVRRILMDEACSRLMRAGNPDGIIASTDGDTMVDSQWVYHIIEEIARGNDAVGGRIIALGEASLTRVRHLRNVTYRCLLAHAEAKIDPQLHDPWPRHFQYYGASLAVTCKMYQQAGRLPKVPYLEDDAFHNALVRNDAKIRKSFKVKVYTSDRTSGRVAIGFSEQLKKWHDDANASIPHLVEPASAMLSKYKIRRKLRACYLQFRQTGDCHTEHLTAVGGEMQVDTNWLHEQLISATHFGKFWEIVEQTMQNGLWKETHQPELISQAIHQLRCFIQNTV